MDYTLKINGKDYQVEIMDVKKKILQEEEMIEEWRNIYWPELQKASFDSESKLEKYLFTVSTGAVGLLLGTMGFIDKPNSINLLFLCFGSFVVAMLICIFYHIIAIHGHNIQFRMIEDLIENPSIGDMKIRDNIKRMNRLLDYLPIFSSVFIIAGIVLFIIYLSYNI